MAKRKPIDVTKDPNQVRRMALGTEVVFDNRRAVVENLPPRSDLQNYTQEQQEAYRKVRRRYGPNRGMKFLEQGYTKPGVM